MFSTLLVANRGEIALRVIRGARALGIRTVAVYSDADHDAPHVRAADTAVHIGPTPAPESYLSIEAILDAARRSGADAVHPGYGFLSERSAFARAVTDAGLVFVGPDADVMDRMGRKDAAREIAMAAGVPVVPSYGLDDDPGTFTYPVLVKAAAGGGGKGMRIVREASELPGAVAAAGREARAAFGDDTLLIERYVELGRHVEMQVLADHHGTVIHLAERDCSAQRRHQKVVEEAPAPGLSDVAREVLHRTAVDLCREVGYTNAGTVEYLVSGDEVFFLEMNTRLQVEHPVTEAVTGLDLVQLQLRIAAGLPLGITQEDVRITGHAFEARVYAEDAWAGFLPQAGVATHVTWPDGVRVDAALESGQRVGTAYDPMLGKVIAHGPDRETARRLLVAALDRTAIIGLTTNTGFLRTLVASEAMRDAAIDTAWLDRHELEAPDPAPARAHAAGAVLRGVPDASPFGAHDGWRLGGPAATTAVRLDGEPVVPDDQPGPQPAAVLVSDHVVDVALHGHWFRLLRTRTPADELAAGGDGTIVAPMPGTVTRLDVAAGDRVTAGQALGVLEAMKMELPLTSPVDGVVRTLGAGVGDQVALKHVLIEIDADLDSGESGDA